MESVLTGGRNGGSSLATKFFYLQTVVFAVIIGYSESYVYLAYSETSGLARGLAVGRAVLSQTAIVLMAVAAIKISEHLGGGVRGFLATVPVYVLIAYCALPAAWFMREAAIQFHQTGMLSRAQSDPILLPGVALYGAGIDPTIIASLPFYQVALAFLGPYITRNRTPETEQERNERQRREQAEAEHAQRMALLRAKGRRARVAAYLSTAQEPEIAATEEEAPPSAESTITPLRTAPSVRAKHWTYQHLMQYAAAVYQHEMDAEDARRAVQFIGRGKRDQRQKGAPYIASPQACRAWMKVQPWAAKSEDMQEVVAQ